ncbi:protein sorting system archaetidylserine decarboxylase [Salinarchaeum laminariae]|uniref:protein sorting system archaetidylserine decarboxylase n=1 Tax=Salinarchaeum laminariae TaxID=869888 RepID=UPI0020BD5078|nr:protein sorting system archaetidylserine decarboxylase [Salinarchaeum laminariae]
MKIAPGGLRYGAVLVAMSAPALLIGPVPAAILLLLGLGALWFHRDPERTTPESGVIAPADGTVSVIREESDGPRGDGDVNEPRLLVGTFMNVHDVHVNRSPLPGTVTDVDHQPGAHKPAFSKESDRNERVVVDLNTDAGPLTVTLIAGAFARRIHPYVEPADDLDRGERIGHISFGSRVDVLFPPGVERADLAVEKGDSVTAGETVLVRDDSLE